MSLEKQSFETETQDVEEDEEIPVEIEPLTAETVRVTAPATLVGGATFGATVDGVFFLVVVPKPGVIQGDTFEVPYPSSIQSSTLPMQKKPWRSNLWNCCSGGTCMCFVAFFCPLMLYTQVMERLNLSPNGYHTRPRTRQVRSSGCCYLELVKRVFFFGRIHDVYLLSFFYIGVLIVLAVILEELFGIEIGSPLSAVVAFSFPALIVFMFVALVCARRSFRQTHDLPVSGCTTAGDCMVTSFCCPCSAIQMAAHDAQPYEFFSRTGLRKHSRQQQQQQQQQQVMSRKIQHIEIV